MLAFRKFFLVNKPYWCQKVKICNCLITFSVQYVSLQLWKHKHKNVWEPVTWGGVVFCLLMFANSASPLMLCIAVCKAKTEKPGDVGHEKRPSRIPGQGNLLTEKFRN